MRLISNPILFVVLFAALESCGNRTPPATAIPGTTIQTQFVELTPVLSSGQDLRHAFRDVAIIDNARMWAVGYDGHDPRRLWRSVDGGESWQIVPIRSTGFTLSAIDFPDDLHGFAVGGYGTIVFTNDGGENWAQLRQRTSAHLECVSFVNEKVGYVAGGTGTYDRDTDTSTYGVEVLKTTDGGKTWRRTYRDDDTRTVWQLVTPSENTAFLLLDANRLMRTVDGGKSWHEVMFKYRGPTSIAFTQDGIGWMVGEKLFYRSTDGGQIWRTPDNLPSELMTHDWWSIAFADEKIGMAVSEDSAIAITYDSGQSWSEIKSNMHNGPTIWYDASIGFKEHLRAVRLHERSGIILGSQRVLLIKGFGSQRNQK